MAPRRRSFSFLLLFICLNNGPALCQTVGPGVPQSQGPLQREYVAPSGSPKSQLLNTLLSIASANGVLPNVLPAIQKVFPESQNLAINEGIPQPQEVPNGLPSQQCFTPNLSVNPNSLPPLPQSNLGAFNPYLASPKLVGNEVIPPLDVTNGRSCQQCFTPNLFVTKLLPYPNPPANLVAPNPLPPIPSYTILPPTASPPYQISSFLPSPPAFASPPFIPQQEPPITIIDHNYNSISPGPVTNGDIFGPNCNLQPEIFQSPFNLQIPQMLPPTFPIATPPAPPVPSDPFILPSQNIKSWPYLPEPNALPISTPIEVQVTNIGSNTDTATDCGNQLPLPINLHISMPAPVIPEPIITVISTSSPAPESSSFNIPFMPPIHVVEKSRSRWKRWLPIILLALLDGGCGNNCGGGCSGCQCGSNIPIPYPIPIPTNNPIVIG